MQVWKNYICKDEFVKNFVFFDQCKIEFSKKNTDDLILSHPEYNAHIHFYGKCNQRWDLIQLIFLQSLN